jgi:hypothetical protein
MLIDAILLSTISTDSRMRRRPEYDLRANGHMRARRSKPVEQLKKTLLRGGLTAKASPIKQFLGVLIKNQAHIFEKFDKTH